MWGRRSGRFGAGCGLVVLGLGPLACAGSGGAGAAARTPSAPEGVGVETQVANLAAFARLYGYVRFFHPSDEAATVDWDRMAIHGAERARRAATAEDLRQALEDVFAPVAPSLRFRARAPGTAPAAGPGVARDADRAGRVAWQHQGVGVASWSFYSSTRTNRSGMLGGMELVRMAQALPAVELRGRHVRLRAAARAEVEPGVGNARLTLMVSRVGATGFVDEMADRPIVDPEWREYEIRGRIDDDAHGLFVGPGFWGSGRAWFDAFELSTSEDGETWTPLALQNPDMEAGADGAVPGWGHFAMGTHPAYHRFSADTTHAYRGGTSALLHVDQPDRLFDDVPAPGERIEASIGRGLWITLPLTLSDSAGRTVPMGDPALLGALASQLDAIDPSGLSLSDPAVRLANVIITWSILRHFYPYAEEVPADWADVLEPALAEAVRARTDMEHLRGLQRMLAALADGHARVDHPLLTRLVPLPLALDRVDGRLLVVHSLAEGIRPGDEVVLVDGVPADDLFRDAFDHASGSDGYRRMVALATMTRGEPGSTARVRIRRDGREETHALTREPGRAASPPRPAPVSELAPGVHYVDMTRVGIGGLATHMEELAAADALVFDVRGYPTSGAFEILLHLADEPVGWSVGCPQPTIRPDRRPAPTCDPLAATIWHEPAQPRFRGRAAFMTSAGAMSYGDLVMAAVEHHRLGEIVGSPTGGANGNQNGARLLANVQIAWTGAYVRKLDGSAHHAIGAQPTVPAARTARGIRQGRDDVLDAALAALGVSIDGERPDPR